MAGGAARRTERLMCLVFLLKARGRRGITRAELRECIEDYAACPNEDAFERALERDKSSLREVGVVIDVVARDAWYEDEFAYVLGSSTLMTLPVTFDADELQVLGLAAETWERGTWNAMAHGALRKLEVFTDAYPAETTPRISVRADEHLESIRSAIRDRMAVRFHYRRPGDAEPAAREVEPWGLLYRQGGWYCVGFDRERNAPRVFRTSRIDGTVARGSSATHDIDPAWPEIVRSGSAAASSLDCTLLIEPGHGWAWRGEGRVTGSREIAGTTYDTVDVTVTDQDALVSQLAAAAPRVLVAQPTELQERVRTSLEAVLHG